MMQHSRVEFVSGDAVGFRPGRTVDWLLCDVIAAPERSIDLLLEWLALGAMRRFVVSIKLRGLADHPALERLNRELPRWCDEWQVMQLCANKGEVCAFGSLREVASPNFP
jgi:23S rRNA (cytidine2498-2'-O)-methyltransferase